MKKLTLLLSVLMIAGATYACDGGKDAKACCKKGEKKECCSKKHDKKCCDKEAKKEDKKATSEKKA
jgi:hypothetical protein